MTHILRHCSFGILILVTVCTCAADREQAILGVHNSVGDRIEVVELRPSFDRELAEKEFHRLKDGQRMSVQFQYTIESVEGARIFVEPHADGKRLRKFAAKGSPIYPKGSAKASSYFELTDESEVDELQIQMWSSGKQLLVLKIPTRIKGAEPAANPVDPYTTPTFLAISQSLKEQGRLALDSKIEGALAIVEKALEAPVPENVHPESWKAHLETSRVQILCFIDKEKAADLAVKYQPSHLQLLQKNLSETDVVVPVLHSQRRMIDSLRTDQPDTAIVLVQRLEAALEDTSESDGAHIFRELRSARRHLESSRRSIERAKKASK
ncbi:hypothetical protein NZK35_25725 [Stieleria sp. ICT_E10.1]|uniref:hypothetical protein n=1 Tax=Stieleria sedimenti TaxID=2976331 RepID=UPI0021801BBE|nr:hypothetical protein [Stieleria sedimenti]MCS7470058.1 hypothetical protein [Stieleria sedimenti]